VVLVITARPDRAGFSFRRLIHSLKTYDSTVLYNYKKNKSLQIKAFIVNLNPDTDVLSTSVSFITRGGFRGGVRGVRPSP
jgi:uncharacterized protein YgiB involved in biofilm formation